MTGPVLACAFFVVVMGGIVACGWAAMAKASSLQGIFAAATGSTFFLFALAANGNSVSALLPGVAGAGFGYLLPRRIGARRAALRHDRIRRGLPTALDLCVLCLEAGQTLDQALMETSRGLRRSYPDLADELELTYVEIRTSNDRALALRNLAARCREPELRKIVNLMIDSDRFGANIIPALRGHASYVRTRRRQAAHESARKLSVRLIFPVFFLIFPSVMLVTLGPACILVFNQIGAIMGGK